MLLTLHEKTYFLFPNVLKRWSFEKTCTGVWSFLYYQERRYFFFPKIWLYSLDKKNERWSSSKTNTWKYDIFFKCSEKMVFTRKYDIFSLNGKWKMIFLKKYKEILYFLYICMNVTDMILLFCQKNQRRSSPEKIHLKVIDIIDWHSRKSSNGFLYFNGDLDRRFHILLFSEKKRQET